MIASRWGASAISSILASWMVTGLAIAGVIYLISIIIINLFKRSELEKWLRQSTWGVASQHWEPLDEITKLEQIIHRPQVELVAVQTHRPEWTSNYTTTKQWQLVITFPAFTEGKMIGLQIARQPQSSSTYGIAAPQKPIAINEQLGRWTQDDAGNPVFSVKLGGSDRDKVAVAIKMPLNWANSDEFTLGFAASGCQSGSLSVAPIEREIGARSMIVGDNG